MVFYYLGAFGDVGSKATIAIAHGFQQTHRHAFEITRQHIDISIAVQLRKFLTLDKTSQHDARIGSRSRLNLFIVFSGIGRSAGDDQLLISIQLLECLDKIMHAFFRHDTA